MEFFWSWCFLASWITTVCCGCRFPIRWTGRWYQKGLHPPVRIEGDTFSFKGFCVDFDGDLFLIEDRKEKCVRCVVIYEKHVNVLQYRETYCDEYSSLQEACSALNVDAHLYSLFRVEGHPVGCPFKGPFTFTYRKGHGGDCKYPLSTVDTCTHDSKLLFRFQPCADVRGTESSVEELTCLALWKEGSSHYLVGKLVSKTNSLLPFLEEDHYRCFVYDYLADRSGFQLSQSDDATCDGLVSPWEGSRVMRFTKSKPPSVGCSFPSWVTFPHRWHTLDSKRSYIFGHRNSSMRVIQARADTPEKKVSCTQEVYANANLSTLVAYSMSGCDTGFICMTFHRRDRHIVELQVGDYARRPQDACQPLSYDPIGAEFVTLVTPSTTAIVCPRLVHTNGLRVEASAQRYESCRESGVVAVVGCRSYDTIEFLTTCQAYRDRKTFQCHGGWEESGRNYLIAELKGSRSKYCFVYSSVEKVTQLSGLHDTCHRSILPGVTGNLTFNISAAGDCEKLLDGSASLRLSWVLSLVYLAVTSLFVLR